MKKDYNEIAKKTLNNDAVNGVFVANELKSLDARVFKTMENDEPVSKEFLNYNTSVCAAGADSYAYKQITSSGVMERISAQGTDISLVDIKGEEFTLKNVHYGKGYAVTTQEMRAAAMAGTPLENQKADAVALANLQKNEALAWIGEPDGSKKGLLNHASITDVAGNDWTDVATTGEEMYQDVATMIESVMTDTLGKFKGIKVAMSPRMRQIIALTRRDSTVSTNSVLTELKLAFPDVMFATTLYCQNAKTVSGTDYDVMIAMPKNDLVAEFILPLPLTRAGSKIQEGVSYKSLFESMKVGTVIRIPLAVKRTYVNAV